MSKKDEAMKLALEALQTAHLAVECDMLADEIQQAITALQEALAEQPAPVQQEPMISTEHGPWIPSTHPGEEGESYCKRCLLRDKFLGSRQCDPHIVPTPAAQQQEPVAHFGSAYVNENGVHVTTVLGPVAIPKDAKLYTSPPAQRTWVGLTDEEIINVMPDDDTPMSLGEAFSVFAEAIEAKLKEKNT